MANIIHHSSEGPIDVNSMFLIANAKQDRINEGPKDSKKSRKREFSLRIYFLQDEFHRKLYDLVASSLKLVDSGSAPESLEDVGTPAEDLEAPEDLPTTPESFQLSESNLDHSQLYWMACGKNRQKLYSKHSRPRRREVELPLRIEHLNIQILRKLRKVLRDSESTTTISSRKRPSSEVPPTPAKQAKSDNDFSSVTYVSTTPESHSEDVGNCWYQEAQSQLDIDSEEERYQAKKAAKKLEMMKKMAEAEDLEADKEIQMPILESEDVLDFFSDLEATTTTDEEDFEWFNTFFAAN